MSKYNPDDMKIEHSIGGPCIYRQGVFPDGTRTGRIQWTGQTPEQMKAELMASLQTGRDDVTAFVASIPSRFA